MYFTDDSLLPENQEPLIICVAPYGPEWLPGDYPEDIPVSWEAQVQKAVDCYNAGGDSVHLGLPPNRKSGQQGFMAYETDGKVREKASLTGAEHRLIGV